MRRKTRVLTPVFRQLSFSQLISTVCRILPHCAHAADMNFYLSIFWILIRIGIQRCRFWSTSQFLLSAGYPSEPSSTDEDSDPYPPFYLGKKTFFRFFSVSAKYSCGFPDPQVLPIIVVDRYLDYFTTIMEDRL